MEVGYGLVISDMVWYCTSGDTSGDTTGVATPVVLLGHSLLLMHQDCDWSRGASRIASRIASRATYVIPLNHKMKFVCNPKNLMTFFYYAQ